jgi:hypothetical protein
MTNDQAPMSNQTPNSNAQRRQAAGPEPRRRACPQEAWTEAAQNRELSILAPELPRNSERSRIRSFTHALRRGKAAERNRRSFCHSWG